MNEAVNQALSAQPAAGQDVGAVALAIGYARLIDDTAPGAKYTAALEWLARQESDDPDADRHVRTISNALAAHSVASDLGPKLLAALESLNMTPRARNAGRKGNVDDKPSGNPLDQLAQRRAGKRPA